MSEVCLTLLCPASLKEGLFDLLLMSSDVLVFTSTATAVHGLTAVSMSTNEKVLGHTIATSIQFTLPEERCAEILKQVWQRFAGSGIRYWISPVLASGELL
jgi:hypothetical protein